MPVLNKSLQRLLLTTTTVALFTGAAFAQGGVLLQADAAWTADGLISPAFVAIKDGRVMSVSPRAPMMARGLKKIEVEGTLAAGLVDAWSGLLPADLLHQGGRGASLKVADNLPADIPKGDPLLGARVRMSVESGIAASYVPTGGNEIQRGLGCSVNFSGNNIPVSMGFEALDIAMGSSRLNGIAQFGASKQAIGLFSSVNSLRDELDEFPEKLEKYDEDFKKYQEKLEEYKKKKEEAEAAKAEGEEKEKKKLEPPKRPKRPTPPQLNLAQDWLLEVLYGERQVRLYADSASDIRAAIELKQEYGLDLVIVGAGEADLVAEALASAEVPVILAAHGDHASTHPERTLAKRYLRLLKDEVTVALSSGANDSSASSLLITGGKLVAAGAEPEDVWRSLTSIPAELIGVEKEFGNVAPGLSADLISFTGSNPFQTGTPIRVYRATQGF